MVLVFNLRNGYILASSQLGSPEESVPGSADWDLLGWRRSQDPELGSLESKMNGEGLPGDGTWTLQGWKSRSEAQQNSAICYFCGPGRLLRPVGTSRFNMERLMKPPNMEMVTENAQLSRGGRRQKMRGAVALRDEQCDCSSRTETGGPGRR